MYARDTCKTLSLKTQRGTLCLEACRVHWSGFQVVTSKSAWATHIILTAALSVVSFRQEVVRDYGTAPHLAFHLPSGLSPCPLLVRRGSYAPLFAPTNADVIIKVQFRALCRRGLPLRLKADSLHHQHLSPQSMCRQQMLWLSQIKLAHR